MEQRFYEGDMDFGARALQRAQNQQMQTKLAQVAAFNQNPRQFTDAQKESIYRFAQQYGLDTSLGRSRDKSTMVENLVAGSGGLLDALLFGVLKDSWYSNYRTKKAKNIGKILGTVGALVIPGLGALSATKGARALAGGAKGAFLGGSRALRGVTSVGTATKAAGTTAKQAKTFMDLFKAGATAGAPTAKGAVRAAGITARGAGRGAMRAKAVQSLLNQMAYQKALAEMAKTLVRGGQLAGSVSQYSNPNLGEMAPYQELDIMGMPTLQ